MKSVVLVGCASLASIALACGSGSPQGASSVTVDTVGDTIVVSNDVPPSTERVFGSRDVKAEMVWPGDSFFAPGPMAIDSAGRLLVGDRTRVVVIAADRQSSHVLGRAGGGPGEFRSILDLAALGDSGVEVWDGHALRLTWETEAGRVVRTMRVTPPGVEGGAEALPLVVSDSTAAFAWYRGAVRAGGPPDTTYIDLHDVRTDSAHIVAETPRFIFAKLGNVFGPRDAFGIRTIASASPAGYVALSDGVEYVFHLVRLGAPSTYREVRRTWNRRPTSELETAPDSLLATLGNGRSLLEGIMAAQQIGDRKNAIDELWVDPTGRTWIRPVDSTYRYVPMLLGRVPQLRPPIYQWEVFDATGRLLGRTYLPSRFVPQVMRACEVYGLYENDDGTKSVAEVDVPHALCVGAG